MPFLETDDGRAYYRHWAAAETRAAIIFLHGFGEHTGLYHRYGFALNAAGIDLWAVDSTFEIAPSQLSSDPFYLDSMENDPLAFVDADGGPLARELDRGWDTFGAKLPALAVQTLAVHGSNDPIAPIGALRAYAEQLEPLTLLEIQGGGHDILNTRRFVHARLRCSQPTVHKSRGVRRKRATARCRRWWS